MAGIVFQTSFDHYTTLTSRFNSTSFDGASSATGTIGAFGRNSTNGFRSHCQAGNVPSFFFTVKTLPTNLTTFYLAFALKFSALPSSSVIAIAQVSDLGTPQLTINLTVDGTLQVTRGDTNGTILGTSSVSLLSGVYYHIELKATIDPSTGVIELRINEVTVLSLTGQNTRATTNSYITSISLGHKRLGASISVSSNFDYDDLIVRDDTWEGDKSVQAFFPTANGATNNFTVTGASNNYQAVDETNPNDNTDYVQSSVVGDIDLYTYGTISSTASIDAVIPIPWAEKTAAGTAKFANIVRIGSTNYTGVDQAPSDGSYAFFPEILSTSPATGITWTATEFNNLQVGVKRTA